MERKDNPTNRPLPGQEERVMTIREWLERAEIPDDGRGIRDLDVWGHVEITGARWLSFWKNDGRGGLQCHCGGLSIIGFSPVKTTRRALYLVVDDATGRAWDARRAAGETGPGGLPGGPRPNAVLRLVQSA